MKRGAMLAAAWHTALWIAGVAGIVVGKRKMQKRIREQAAAEEARAKSENELQYQKHYLESLVASSPLAIVTLDMERNIRQCNEAFENIFGYTAVEAIGKSLDELIVPVERRQEAQKLTQASYYVDKIHTELVRRRKDGSFIDVEVHAKPIFMDGVQIGIIAQYIDISGRKRSEEKIQMLGHALMSISECVTITDVNDRIIFVNDAFLKTYGYSEQEVIGKDKTMVRSPENDPHVTKQIRSAILAGGWHGELLNRRKDGTEFPVYLSTSAVRDDRGEIVAAVGIASDITERKKTEEVLARERNLLRTLIDNLPDLIFFKDKERRYLLNNISHLRSMGVKRQEDVLGKTDFEFHPRELAEQYSEDEERILSSGKGMFNREERAFHQELGEERWHLTSKIPLLETNGDIAGIVGIARDITERKGAENKLKESEERFRSVWEDSSDGMRLTDEKGIVLNVNRAFCEMMSVEQNEIIGKPLSAVYASSARENVMKKITQRFAAEDIQAHMERSLLLHNGKTITVEVSNSVIVLENGQSVLLSIFRDVTERHKAEEKIKEQIKIIEEQNVELAKAHDKAMAATKAKSTFLASMSHELRTPLNAIIGYSEMLLEEIEDEGETRYRDDLEKIRLAGKNLLGLINEVLDLSKIEAGRMELFLERFDMKTLINEVAVTVQPLMTKNENTFVLNIGEEVAAVHLDITKIRQILFNLISNASKFTQKGTITLEAGVRRSSDGARIVLKVSDTGIGITEEQKAKLFKEFSQAEDSTTRRYGGTGLGLAITKHFCEMMHGSIEVESVPQKGTTFIVILPQSLESTGPETVSETTAAKTEKFVPAGQAVLVVDDDASVRDLLQRFLTKEGYLVECVASGDEGLSRARKLLPMAIILDVMMPHKDGWAVLQEIKSDSALKSIPVIMYTMVDEKNFGLAIGANEYLIKPVNKEKILQVLEKFKHRITREYILIVDDDPNLCDIVRRTIEKEGWAVRTAENGKVALSLLERATPSVVFLDLMMPVMDGFEFLSILESRRAWGHIPVVVVTSKDLSKEERRRLDGSVRKIIQKGDFTPEKLLKHLAELIPRLAHPS
ncbi:MAG: PAS domain S-box protein [Bacteroidota bacterium]|nr:PAS domain S-box protein [Bacteroidota bacterium]